MCEQRIVKVSPRLPQRAVLGARTGALLMRCSQVLQHQPSSGQPQREWAWELHVEDAYCCSKVCVTNPGAGTLGRRCCRERGRS